VKLTTILTKQGLVMVGRKRKLGKRTASGRVVKPYENPKRQVMEQPHRRDLPAQFRDRPEPESPFGQLMCLGIITPAQHEAGKRYRDISFAYRAVVSGAPYPHPQAISLLSVHGRGGEPSRETIQAIKGVYDAAFEALSEAGNRPQRAVKDHAVFERPCTDEYSHALLRRGLDRLVEHYGIDPGLKIERH
jgi:hypothetical protein